MSVSQHAAATTGHRVVDYLVDAIAALGVGHVFGVDGANIEDLYDAIFEADLTHPGRVTGVVAKHEFAAAVMADGYSRTTAGLGVVAATSGGGAMNLVAGLAESFTSRIPVLALIGQPPTALEGHGAFQDTSGRAGTIDLARMLGEITRYCARVERPEDLPEHLDRAVTAARHGGPAALLLPKDIQQAEFRPNSAFRTTSPRDVQDVDGLRRLQAILSAARGTGKVVVVAGEQVARDDARAELRTLVQALDAAVGVVPDAKDVYGNFEPGFCGVAGIMGHPELADAVRESAACVLVGTRMPITARGGLDPLLEQTTVVSLGAEAPYPRTVHATSTDLRTDLAALAAMLTERPAAVPNERPAAVPNPQPGVLAVPPATGPGLRYRDAVDAIAAEMPPGSDVFADAGNTGAAVVHHLPVPDGGRFVVALGMGGMGYSFGAAIGSTFARCRDNDRRTFVIAGDGSFYMHGMEIHTAVEHELPITFIVFNNNAHAMCLTREQLYYRDRYSFNRFRRSDLGAGMAAMFPDLPAHRASTADELAQAVRAAAASAGPSFIAVDCDPDEIPPFTPFLAALKAA